MVGGTQWTHQSLMVIFIQSNSRLWEPVYWPGTSQEQQHWSRKAAPQPAVRGQHHWGKKKKRYCRELQRILHVDMCKDSLLWVPGDWGGTFLGLPVRWSQFGEAASPDGWDQQTHPDSTVCVSVSKPDVFGSLLWEQWSKPVLPCQNTAHTWQFSGGTEILTSYCSFLTRIENSDSSVLKYRTWILCSYVCIFTHIAVVQFRSE